MQWEGKFGPAFVATVFFAFIQIGAAVFAVGMIWSDVRAAQVTTVEISKKISDMSSAAAETKTLLAKRDGDVDGAIASIKQSVGWLTSTVQRLEFKIDAATGPSKP